MDVWVLPSPGNILLLIEPTYGTKVFTAAKQLLLQTGGDISIKGSSRDGKYEGVCA